MPSPSNTTVRRHPQVQHFITNDKVNVAGLVLAGSADFKEVLAQSELLDGRLAAK
jgi:peptide chain release factor subunit 1